MVASEHYLFNPSWSLFAPGSPCNHLYSGARVRQPLPEFLMALFSSLLYFKPYIRSNFLCILETSLDKEALETISQRVLQCIAYIFSNSFFFPPNFQSGGTFFYYEEEEENDEYHSKYVFFFVLYLG